MTAALLFLHFFGLMLGAAGGFGSAIVMRRAAALPADAGNELKALGPVLAKTTTTGLALLWLTGLALVWTKYDGPGSLPAMFWVKFAFVLALTAANLMVLRTYSQIRAGNTARAALLPKIGPVGGISALLAVLFAVVTFSG